MTSIPRSGWKDSLALGVPVIDAQHKGLFDLACDIECALEAGDPESTLTQTVEQLKEYCQQHFMAEERLMHEHGYPALHAHVLQHDDFTRGVLEFEAQREAGTAGVARQVAGFLRKWLAQHISVEDMNIAPFLSQPSADEHAEASGVPVLIEVESTAAQADTSLCTRAANQLLKQGVPFVGLAHSLDETRTTLETLKQAGKTPAIFVINTFGAKGLLAQLDALMDEQPVLYLRRALYAGKSGLTEHVNLIPPAGAIAATVALKKMKPRLTSMWFYGAQNAGVIAQLAAEAVHAYLKSGDFRQIERARPAK